MKNFTLTILSLLLATGVWAQCNNLFFSEYLEGSSFNKAVEIYNPTSNPINLNGYKLILRGFNGSGVAFVPDTANLTGTVPAGGVYVIANPSSNATILGIADATDSIINFNGNDAIALYDNTLGQVIDAVGDYSAATNPAGGNWAVGTGATNEFTLVRKSTVQSGTTTWATSATQWDVLPQNTTTNLGSHTSSCVAVTDTLVVFSPTSRLVFDTATATNLPLRLVNLNSVPNAFTVDVVLKSGNAALVNNFSSQTVNISGTASVALTLVPTPVTGAANVLVFALRNPSNNLELGADSLFTLTIDSVTAVAALPLYTVTQLRGTNTDGLPDSLGVTCRVRGVVLGVNLRTAGYNFAIYDGNSGIGVFRPADTTSITYTVQEGDSIEVTGTVGHFNGYAQMTFISAITSLGNGSVPTPRLVSELNEDTESELVQLNNLRVYGTPTGQNPLTYDVTNGIDSFEMVVYATTGISTTFPTRFNVIGVGRQFDAGGGVPVRYTRFYQIAPRKQADIIPATGLEDLANSVMAVYPNPANNVVNVVLDANAKAETVRVYDLAGSLVLEQSVNGATTIKVDISTLTNGLYILQVASANGTSNHKISKL